ncbi:hypothetical protein [Emticicia agri]|uniref:Uncharacterized protein n=1 Tax=Emticicia agri TaxID=2492393 RepID=A0A4Q5M5X2_9BACT|nr:hypothetical protein [Emticicia agri]RYU97705.1 hypothetical protein EWM59_00855 [Emticicia agri]
MMKTIIVSFLSACLYTTGLAQTGNVVILPDNGSNSLQTSLYPNHKISIKTQPETYGFVQKANQIEAGTFISELNGGYASYGTTGLYTLCLTTNSQNPQVIFNILNFMGIGGQPFNALHVYGQAIIEGVANTNQYIAETFLKIDNNGTLSAEKQTYYYSLPPSAFLPIINSANNPIARSDAEGIYFTLSNAYFVRFEAPVYLPVGAIIKGIEFYFIDNSELDLNLIITRRVLGEQVETYYLPYLYSSGEESGIRNVKTDSIHNGGITILEDSSYTIIVSPKNTVNNKKWDGANMQLIAAKLIYQY